MPAPNYTPEIGATIRGARLVGTPLRTCAKAAGVPWSTCCDWLAKGRAYNEAAPADRNARHAALGQFAAEIDKAGAQAETVLYQRVMKATEKDGGLALKLLQWKADARLRAAHLAVEEKRANGTLVERHEIRDVSDEALLEEANRLIAELRGSEPSTPQ